MTDHSVIEVKLDAIVERLERMENKIDKTNGSVSDHSKTIAVLCDHDKTRQKWTVGIGIGAALALLTAIKEFLLGGK